MLKKKRDNAAHFYSACKSCFVTAHRYFQKENQYLSDILLFCTTNYHHNMRCDITPIKMYTSIVVPAKILFTPCRIVLFSAEILVL